MPELDEKAIEDLVKKHQQKKQKPKEEKIVDRSYFKKDIKQTLSAKLSKSSYKKFGGIKKFFADANFSNYDVSFNDFDFTLELSKEEYEDNKEEYTEYKFIQYDKKTKKYRLAKKECYSFNELAKLVIEANDTEENKEDAFLMIENHYEPGRTKYYFVYRSMGEYITDHYDTEVSSVFFEKDVQKIQFLIKYTMNTIDRAYIMSDEIYNFESPYLAKRGIFFTKYGIYDLVKKLKPFTGPSKTKAIGAGILIFLLMVGGSIGGAFLLITSFEKEAKNSIRKEEREIKKLENKIAKIQKRIDKQKAILNNKKGLYKGPENK